MGDFGIAARLRLAVLAAVLASRLKGSIALVEVCPRAGAGAISAHFFQPDAMGSNLPRLRLLASTGAVLLTFPAGREPAPAVLRAKWRAVVRR